jgi:hypothetical protein
MSSKKEKAFVDLCLEGEALLTDIDRYVESWHNSETKTSLHDYLGLKLDEYALWVEKPQALRYIISSRKNDVPFAKAISQMAQQGIAARAADHDELAEVVEWLKGKGML